ncbi:MAG: methylated-DNA--[protein]-cysteine S-methyltransferase [Pedosphaera sp.]|nr:methylated-DNA--[protein]-cysteine S-methyltransferase [Pedosphaera sp.]
MGGAIHGHPAALSRHRLQTSAGIFTVTFTHVGLACLYFPNAIRISIHTRQPENAAHQSWLVTTAKAIESILKGNTPAVLPPLDLASGTLFQVQVWKQLQRIPRGQTRSYAQIAAATSRPRAARAVGAACGANPIPLLIPCHRVIASDGTLGGFSGGLEWKRRLLAIERTKNC